MRDETCIELLQWALPRLEKRWEGYRKVRDTVCRRIERRMAELEIRSIDAYRDRGVFEALAGNALPRLAGRAYGGATPRSPAGSPRACGPGRSS